MKSTDDGQITHSVASLAPSPTKGKHATSRMPPFLGSAASYSCDQQSSNDRLSAGRSGYASASADCQPICDSNRLQLTSFDR